MPGFCPSITMSLSEDFVNYGELSPPHSETMSHRFALHRDPRVLRECMACSRMSAARASRGLRGVPRHSHYVTDLESIAIA